MGSTESKKIQQSPPPKKKESHNERPQSKKHEGKINDAKPAPSPKKSIYTSDADAFSSPVTYSPSRRKRFDDPPLELQTLRTGHTAYRPKQNSGGTSNDFQTKSLTPTPTHTHTQTRFNENTHTHTYTNTNTNTNTHTTPPVYRGRLSRRDDSGETSARIPRPVSEGSGVPTHKQNTHMFSILCVDMFCQRNANANICKGKIDEEVKRFLKSVSPVPHTHMAYNKSWEDFGFMQGSDHVFKLAGASLFYALLQKMNRKPLYYHLIDTRPVKQYKASTIEGALSIWLADGDSEGRTEFSRELAKDNLIQTITGSREVDASYTSLQDHTLLLFCNGGSNDFGMENFVKHMLPPEAEFKNVIALEAPLPRFFASFPFMKKSLTSHPIGPAIIAEPSPPDSLSLMIAEHTMVFSNRSLTSTYNVDVFVDLSDENITESMIIQGETKVFFTPTAKLRMLDVAVSIIWACRLKGLCVMLYSDDGKMAAAAAAIFLAACQMPNSDCILCITNKTPFFMDDPGFLHEITKFLNEEFPGNGAKQLKNLRSSDSLLDEQNEY